MINDKGNELAEILIGFIIDIKTNHPTVHNKIKALYEKLYPDPMSATLLDTAKFIEKVSLTLLEYVEGGRACTMQREAVEGKLLDLASAVEDYRSLMNTKTVSPLSEIRLLNSCKNLLIVCDVILTQYEDLVEVMSTKIDVSGEMVVEPSGDLIKPSALVAQCDEYVIGQDHVKRAVATYLASYFNSIVSMDNVTTPCLLIAGQSGTGKTYIVNQIAKALDVDFQAIDSTEFTPSGYHGRTVHTVLEEIALLSRSQTSIVLVDEVDKLGFNTGSDNDFIRKVQAELLKAVESYSYDLDHKFCFIFAGAFEDARKKKSQAAGKKGIGFGATSTEVNLALDHEDLIKSGLMREFVGRIGTIVETHPIGEDMLFDLLTKPKDCVKEFYNRLFADQNLKDAVTDDDIKAILAKASDKHRSLGVRGLKTVAEAHFRDRLYF